MTARTLSKGKWYLVVRQYFHECYIAGDESIFRTTIKVKVGPHIFGQFEDQLEWIVRIAFFWLGKDASPGCAFRLAAEVFDADSFIGYGRWFSAGSSFSTAAEPFSE